MGSIRTTKEEGVDDTSEKKGDGRDKGSRLITGFTLLEKF